MNTLANDLTAARALIANRKDWQQGALVDADGCMCLLGAIGVATDLFKREPLESGVCKAYDDLDKSPAVQALAMLVCKQEDRQYKPQNTSVYVHSFNDSNEHEQVIGLLDTAINNLQGIAND